MLCVVLESQRPVSVLTSSLPSFALYGAEFGGEFHQFLYRELPEGFAGDSGVTAEIIYLRPIGRINFKFLHQLEGNAPGDA